MGNNAFIPLYLNSNIIKSLFTILFEEFSLSQTQSRKQDIAFNVTTPLSELIKGKYTQGDFNLQVSNEFSTAQTEEMKIAIISIFMTLMKLLRKNNLISDIQSKDNTNNINIGEYIVFSCKLSEDPLINKFKDINRKNKIVACINNNSDISNNKSDVSNNKNEPIKNIANNLNLGSDSFIDSIDNLAKLYLNKYSSDTNYTLFTKNCINKNINFSLIIEKQWMSINMEHLLIGPVTVVGKVINIVDGKNGENLNSYSSRLCRCLKDQTLSNEKKLFNNLDLNNNLIFNNTIDKFIEVIPIAIYF